MDEEYYKNLAQILVERIGDRHYFNGSAELETEQCQTLLRTSLIIYRKQLLDPAAPGTRSRVTDIVPVWWDFEATGPSGVIPNDFSWSEFRPFLLGAI